MSSPISGFTAIPNPQMLAFMPIQSYLMMYFAGSGWQYGKRKISAMSNEEFNKLTPEQLLQQHSIELKNMLPTLEKSLNDVTPLVKVLILQYGDFIKEAIAVMPQAVQNLLGPTAFQADNLGSIKEWLDKNLPDIPKDIAAGAEEFPATVFPQRELKDTSGMTLAQHEANKKAKLLAEALARVQRQNELKKIGTVKTPSAQVSRDVTKRPAGQSAIMERQRLIIAIAQAGSELRNVSSRGYRSSNNLSFSDQQNDIQKAKNFLFSLQRKIVNLLARYRF